MATVYKIKYTNQCTPQEQISAGGRWYLDSACRRKLSGKCSVTVSGEPTGSGTYDSSLSVSASPQVIAAPGSDFIYIKNTGTDSVNIYIALDENGLPGGSTNGNYLIVLSDGEAFASNISTIADVWVKTSSGTTTAEYLRLT